MDFDEAEAAAGSIKPAWDAGDADAAAEGFTPAWGNEATATAVAVEQPTTTIVEMSSGPIVPAPAVIINPVISVGPSVPEPAAAPPGATSAVSHAPVSGSTVLGMSPAAQAIAAAENARVASLNTTAKMAPFAPASSAASAAPTNASPQSTRLGGISPEAAAIVAAANAAFRAPMPTTEIDSSSFIEAAVPAPAPKPPSVAPPPVKPASTFPTAAAAQAAPFAVKDPFKSPSRSLVDDALDDLPIKKKTSPVLFVAIGVVALAGIGGVAKLATGGDDAPKPVPSAMTRATPPPPTNDIPPPPPADEVPPPAAPTTTAAAKPVEPVKTAEPAPPHAAKPPAYAAHPAPPPPPAPKAPPAAPTPKSPPKSPGGGIVRDSPF